MPRSYARYVLGLMVAINLLNYMDRWVAAAASPLIQAQFHLSDFEVGLLGTAFLLVYAVSALPFGYWADRGIRKDVISAGVAIWSVATIATGLVSNFFQLFTARAVLGVGEAGYYPAGTSLLGDYFPATARGRAMSIWGAGSVLGIAIGFAGGGLIAARFGWRAAFFATALPGLLCAFLAHRVREPLRGAEEAAAPAAASAKRASIQAFFRLLEIPTLRWVIVSQTFLFFVLAANAYWLPISLHRRFAMGVGTAGVLSGAVIVSGGLVGTLLGGWVADRRARKTARAYLEVPIVGFIVGAVAISVALLGPFELRGLPVFIPAFFLAVVGLYLYSGPFTAISQNVVTPDLRAGAVTMLLLIAHIFGDSHSTADVGFLSDRLGGRIDVALFLVSVPLLILAALSASFALRHVARDTKQMQDTWATVPTPGTAPA